MANNSAISCAFIGNDLKNSLSKCEECRDLCASTPECTHYNWNDYNSGTCFMKKNAICKCKAVPKYDQNAVCGIVDSGLGLGQQIQWNHQNAAPLCAFSGNDLTNAPSKCEDCSRLCESTLGCTHFTWTDFNSGTCFMKQNIVTKSEAISKIDQNALCGIIDHSNPAAASSTVAETVPIVEPNSKSKWSSYPLKSFSKWEAFPPWLADVEMNSRKPGNVAQSGRSTRYWDCCKPSCAWDGKASVTSPIRTCSKDGYNPLDDRNAQNGCGGGNAYTCNNNIPWAINDELAYGFAAAHISGQSEADWCCKCYRLKFTSDPVNGKTMIVQVTNTGGDLGETHFDIQIPGGGVGIFNGCSSQCCAPDNGWGDKYGGVHSKEECDQLPSEIRQGCKWRFQWFQGADNPNFDFDEVPCTDELISKTGCARY